MAAEVKKEIELEIAHVLFIDIVGYTPLLLTTMTIPEAQQRSSRDGLLARSRNRCFTKIANW
jgi:hypothetical protein